MKDENFHLFFGMFANRLRAGILVTLMEKPMPVTELAAELDAERSRVSHALLAMQRCHVVESEKKGKQRLYSLNKDTVKPLLRLVDRHAEKYCKYCWEKKQKELDKRG
ncbi:MAG: metalloregulator ArsR/SmtB family transcription factor [Candidatus Diapherotrites archaeon]|nr:metalloregulator ArsR/SmtB family transcription factor [Candidatus Diapherotrites archaeon]